MKSIENKKYNTYVLEIQYDTYTLNNHNEDDIYLIQQFHLGNDNTRNQEIVDTLKRNVDLCIFKKIILLNERYYSTSELGLNNSQMELVEQIVIGRRLKYNDIDIIYNRGLKGYVIICNNDIFFDNSILNIRSSSLSKDKCCNALLRYQYVPGEKLEKCQIYGPYESSQDTWIFHTNFINKKDLTKLNIPLGYPGCDNVIAYQLRELGYKIFNEPKFIKTYHNHNSKIRNYTSKDRINQNYLFLKPNV